MYKQPRSYKNTALILGLIGAIGAAIYPAIIYPMMYPEGYKKIQATARANIKQEDIQPGNMKVWTDPFDRK